jgi:hypothetical protein
MFFGYGITASNNNVMGFGNSSFIDGQYSVSLGLSHDVRGDYSIMMGYLGNINSLADYSVGLGDRVDVDNPYAVAIGASTVVQGDNSIAIGYGTSVTEDNTVIIGNAQTQSIGGYVNWTATSDGRFKTNVQSNVPGLDFIDALEPVTYNFDIEKLSSFNGFTCQDGAAKSSVVYSGFIAQDVERVSKILGYDFSGVKVPQNEDEEMYGIRYAEFVVPLVQAAQELNAKIESQQLVIELQQMHMNDYEASISHLINDYEASISHLIDELKALKSEVQANTDAVSITKK